jgi:hypothetical protein
MIDLTKPTRNAGEIRALKRAEHYDEGTCRGGGLMLDSQLHRASSEVSRRWWVFLVSGLVWLLIAVIVLRFNETSVATIGLMLGAVFLFAAVHQITLAGLQGGGWAVFGFSSPCCSSERASGPSSSPTTPFGLWRRPSACS